MSKRDSEHILVLFLRYVRMRYMQHYYQLFIQSTLISSIVSYRMNSSEVNYCMFETTKIVCIPSAHLLSCIYDCCRLCVVK